METRANIKLTLDQGLAVARDVQADLSSSELAHVLGVPHAFLLRRSLDARRKSNVHFVVTAGVGTGPDAPAAIVPLEARPLPQQHPAPKRPLVVGTGPAGLYAALELAEAGLCPLVIERGAPTDERRADVERFHATRVLDTRSNVQFGEGGAGTFSDGKLTCGKNSPLMRQVLETFVAAGAPPSILWEAKPHIGTDVLGSVVSRIRARICACGGDVRFHTQLLDFSCTTTPAGTRALERVVIERTDDTRETLPISALILACGHSARDTFSMLAEQGVQLEPKPFSMGVRIEHLQEHINRAQYGQAAGHAALGAADYKLACHLDDGRSVYTFCMCPGGEVVAAASEPEELCINGMSNQARDGANANAALLCNVVPADFGSTDDPLAGVAFQRRWEHAAYCAGGSDWRAPVQTMGAFLGTDARARSTVEPSYPLGVNEADLGRCLPGFVTASLRRALPSFDRRLRGFTEAGALLCGIEARSSSPVRIVRDASTMASVNVAGLYPCGEGAGYAGGIMSAALDGIRVARALMNGTAAAQ